MEIWKDGKVEIFQSFNSSILINLSIFAPLPAAGRFQSFNLLKSYCFMKKYSLIILSMVFLLTGCVAKSAVSLTFDTFTIKFYDNNKKYNATSSDTNIVGIKPLFMIKEDVAKGNTGFINSFIIVRTNILSWTNVKELATANEKKNQSKLIAYKTLDTNNKKIKCKNAQYSWYTMTFSYQVNRETIYGGQYFFIDQETVYLVSLSSDTKKDITAFMKSIGTIKCL